MNINNIGNKKNINVSVDYELWKEARERGINISEACNQGIEEKLNRSNLKNMSLDQLKRKLEIVKRREALQKELKELPDE